MPDCDWKVTHCSCNFAQFNSDKMISSDQKLQIIVWTRIGILLHQPLGVCSWNVGGICGHVVAMRDPEQDVEAMHGLL